MQLILSSSYFQKVPPEADALYRYKPTLDRVNQRYKYCIALQEIINAFDDETNEQ
jgi:hypothetical protein